jgi:CRP-like cAMP-binding protein
VESQRLQAIPLFADLPEPELEALAGRAKELEVEVGETLVAEGEFGHCVFAIEEGTARVSRGGETLSTLGPGDVIGEVAVLASGRRSATVVAGTPMRLISLFKRDVWALEDEAPQASERLRDLVGTRDLAAASEPE